MNIYHLKKKSCLVKWDFTGWVSHFGLTFFCLKKIAKHIIRNHFRNSCEPCFFKTYLAGLVNLICLLGNHVMPTPPLPTHLVMQVCHKALPSVCVIWVSGAGRFGKLQLYGWTPVANIMKNHDWHSVPSRYWSGIPGFSVSLSKFICHPQ